jgi:hypothetical protein
LIWGRESSSCLVEPDEESVFWRQCLVHMFRVVEVFYDEKDADDGGP